MATDVRVIIDNICSFFDIRNKSVIHVGAGGGQLIGYAHHARSVLAVDSDPDATASLEAAVRDLGLVDRFRIVHGAFSSIIAEADVVFFEFCLHEVDDPVGALSHAQSLVPEILVVDHVPSSRWAWHTCEEEKAARSWAAVRQLRVVREASFTATQHFESYPQLLSKVQILGEQAIIRSRQFSGQDDIDIEMGYGMALIRTESVIEHSTSER